MAEDGYLAVIEHCLGEDCDDAGFAVWVLAWTEDVGRSDDGVVEVVKVAVGAEVVFDGEFGDGVRGKGLGVDGFARREGRGIEVAVDGSAG